ncbi:hypothetical protein IJ21_36370 [Paenibacillus sp. 32O-W]|uniref:N-acyl-D-glucosamine 2-epimerase n=1 Tax=Paenibacillus sp. 32O-W TaxID=1695218 RepID=UPI000722273B|nr:N-acyl-D-glucosamine 2-epimerase [Paenibacillus sp. 32O-W]ALS29025.1 hypothetical protein IJ21_36370 [Paenibacillus sp. 32O-W]
MAKAEAIYGPSIQVDPAFPYYLNRTADSIAEEIGLAGYRIVHYFVVNENRVDGELIDAFRRRGMAVWAMTLGNGTYSTERFPAEWPSWRMELLKEPEDGYVRLSPFSDGYVTWKKEALARLVRDYPFDGIEIAEPYFPEWDGIRRGVYGDVGPLARQAFRERYGREMPDFRDPARPDYYLNDPDTYRAWVEFRVEAVNGFLDELINGAGGVRAARPDILVATWSLAVDAGADAADRLREMQGLDAAAMIGRVRPDIHYLQTHWPDWIRGDLPPDYVIRYKNFVDRIRYFHPRIPLAVQADIGSARGMVKGGEWLDAFRRTVRACGFASWTAYEYHIGGYMYERPPVPLQAVRKSDGTVTVSFSKRIDAATGSDIRRYKLRTADGLRPVEAKWTRASVDGNRVKLWADSLPEEPFVLEIGGVADTPELMLYPPDKALEVAPGTCIGVSDPEAAELGSGGMTG